MAERSIASFDHHDPTFHDERHARWAELRATCPVAFNPNYGGFWAVSGYRDVAHVARDETTFSSRYAPEQIDGVSYIGITGVPRLKGMPPAGIAEADHDTNQALRRVLNPFMLPGAVDTSRPFMQAVTTWFLDQHIAVGQCDLVTDLLGPVPAVLTMQLIGLPCDQWPYYAALFHGSIAYRAGSAEHRAAVANVPAMIETLLAEVASRRANPRDDLLTQLVQLDIDGRPLDDQQLISVLWNLIGGGLDTTTSLTSLALHHLDTHPDDRRRLIEDPSLLVSATDEFLRYFSVNETLTRTCTRDVVLGDQRIEKGQPVMISWSSANRDADEFADPEHVVLDRAPNRHVAFGVGPRRCIGLHVARALFQVMVTEVLTRIPDYRVDHDSTRFYDGNPELTGVVTMPTTFTPGRAIGSARRPF
jgi:cytochrome P450